MDNLCYMCRGAMVLVIVVHAVSPGAPGGCLTMLRGPVAPMGNLALYMSIGPGTLLNMQRALVFSYFRIL